MQSTDSFVLFFQQDPKGVLKDLVAQTQDWQALRAQTPSAVTAPLRQHLVQWFLTEILDRLSKVAKSPKTDELHQTCLQKQIVLEDLSWPYKKWDQQSQVLVVDKRKPISMNKMLGHFQELVEDFRDPSLTVRFQSMATSAKTATVPWRLQLNLRSNRAYDLLHTLCHNSVWHLMGTSLKAHTVQQSGLALSLQTMINPSKGQGKGKGKRQ